MKNIIIACFLSAVSFLTFGQQDSIPEFDEDYYTSIKDLREAEKFRFGVDLSTVTIHSLLGAPTRARGSVVFNKKTGPNKAIRFIPAYEETRSFTDFNTTTFNVVRVTDTSVVYRDDYRDRYRVTGRFGKEWFKQYSRHSAVYGVDLVLGYTSEKFSYVEWHSPYDTEGIVEPITVGPGFFSPEEFSSVENFRYLIGVDFSLGYRVWLGEKVDLTIEWIPEISYRPFIKRETVGPLFTTAEIPNPELLFDFRGLTLQLHYKFLKR